MADERDIGALKVERGRDRVGVMVGREAFDLGELGSGIDDPQPGVRGLLRSQLAAVPDDHRCGAVATRLDGDAVGLPQSAFGERPMRVGSTRYRVGVVDEKNELSH